MSLGAASLRAAAAVDPERVATLAQGLVRARSVVEEGSTEHEAAAFVANGLRELGFEPRLEEVAPGRPNVVCEWAGSGFVAGRDRTLLFEGHTDVVTEGYPERWSVPPFEGRIVGDVLHGRGSADMKAGVAAAIAALDAVRRSAPEVAGRIRLGIVVDEEGMMLGIKHFIERGWADDVDGAIVCEPEENEICLHQKGAMRLNVRFRGVMSHGAMPYAGVNPIVALTDFVDGVRAVERAEQERLGEHPYLGLPWLTPTIVAAPAAGEAQHNVMPEHAYLALDIRTVPGQNHDVLLARIEDLARGLERATPRLSVEVERFESRPWTETPAHDPLVRAIETAYPAVMGRAPRYGGVPGATDGTFLRAWRGVPIVTLGPGDRTIPHQLDEFVRLPDVVAAARLYAATAVEYFGPEPANPPVGTDGSGQAGPGNR